MIRTSICRARKSSGKKIKVVRKAIQVLWRSNVDSMEEIDAACGWQKLH